MLAFVESEASILRMGRLVGILGAIVSLFALTSCNSEEVLFFKLQEARREPERAEVIAKQLSQSRRGIKLALADMDCFGGGTRGWSSTILIMSELNDYVMEELTKIIENKSLDKSKRIEATHIMWIRTKNTHYLSTLYDLVEQPGDASVRWGRRKLANTIALTEIANPISLSSESSPISISKLDFQKLIENSQNIILP